jgi:hypothetical protein
MLCVAVATFGCAKCGDRIARFGRYRPVQEQAPAAARTSAPARGSSSACSPRLLAAHGDQVVRRRPVHCQNDVSSTCRPCGAAHRNVSTTQRRRPSRALRRGADDDRLRPDQDGRPPARSPGRRGDHRLDQRPAFVGQVALAGLAVTHTVTSARRQPRDLLETARPHAHATTERFNRSFRPPRSPPCEPRSWRIRRRAGSRGKGPVPAG